MATSSKIPEGSLTESEISHESGERRSIDLPENSRRHHSSFDVDVDVKVVVDLSSISCLPKAILLKIFSFLDVESLLECSKVSRLWGDLASNPTFWENIDISANMSSQALDAVAKFCGSSVRIIRIKWNKRREFALHRLISGSTNLESIIIRNDSVSDRTLKVIALNCNKVKRLDIRNANLVRGDGIEVLCKNCNCLQYLVLRGAVFLDKDIEAVARGCPRLNVFGGDQMLYFSPQALGRLARSCQELRGVFLEDCSSITDEHVRELVSNCSRLTHLSLCSSNNITNASLYALSKHCAGLQDLNFNNCSKLSHDGLAALARNCFHLNVLDLGGSRFLTDKTLSLFLDHCPSLAKLHLKCCKKLTDASLIHLARSQKLNHLCIWGNNKITDAGVRHLSVMKQLKELSLNDCSGLSGDFLYQFAYDHDDLEVRGIDGCFQQ